MSTRGGQFVTLKQLIKEVGRDATRLLFLSRKTDSHLDFDLELAKKQSPDNPVYYIQYAHARICSILDFERTKKIKAGLKADLSLIKEPEEEEIVKKLQQFPLIVEVSINTLEPYRLYLYLHELAGAFHYFYTKHRVVSEDKNLTSARLLLVDSLRIVLATGLKLLGVSAPRKM
jgi:arginyl-tRNA synthetase